MKVEYKLFTIIGVFAAVMGVIYGYFTHWEEPVGPVALFLTGGLCAMIAFYLWRTGAKLDPRPDDDPYGEIDQIEGDFGFFAPYSWWPLFLGLAAAILFLGAAVGWWLVIIAIPFGAVALVGWVFEYSKGDDAV